MLTEETPVAVLEVTSAWKSLTSKEKLYVHWLSKACWAGAPIVFHQVSPESPLLFALFQRLLSVQSIESLMLDSGVTSEESRAFLNYVSTFYGNMGNFLSFGDTKFTPNLSKESFRRIIEASSARGKLKDEIQTLLDLVIDDVYSLDEKQRMLDYPEAGVSMYYSSNVSKRDIELVNTFMAKCGISPYNTRLFKSLDGKLNLRIACGLHGNKAPQSFPLEDGLELIVSYGDYDNHLKDVSEELKKSAEFVANDHERDMIHHYIRHFLEGDIEFHKEAQRSWIKNVQPAVETNIGFIESYRDPSGVRGEFEGFVAVVNKETSRKFSSLVTNAPRFLSKLPWPPEYEKDKFLKPDFSSLEVVTFAASGIPAGINIPNYDDIRQNEGFKNVSLGNVLSAADSKERVTFLHDKDQEIYQKFRISSFEVQVGCHELLGIHYLETSLNLSGHGSGKLFCKKVDGSLNCSSSVLDPISKSPISSWYEVGDTYDSLFGAMSSSFEECRAECVGILLSADRELLELFGYSGKDAEDVTYVNWLDMARKGVLALEFFTPESKKWRQAHMQARFAILQCMLEAGECFIQLDPTSPDAVVLLDRTKIQSVGVAAVSRFLHHIQIYKSTANVKAATAFYNKYTSVSDKYLQLRENVMSQKKPRRVFVQPNTEITSSGEVVLKVYEASPKGMIESFVDRFGIAGSLP